MEDKNTNIIIYTDGACRANGSTNNIGAYAFKLMHKDKVLCKSGNERNTTNNKMELKAVIEALNALKSPSYTFPIHLYSDSQYVTMGVNSWSKDWILKDFVGVKNAEIWKELLSCMAKFTDLHIHWVKGHGTDPNNNEVDKLCNDEMDKELLNKI